MKNIITMEERENIYDDMTDILCQYDYDYTADAVYNIIDTWAEQKADLIALFKKHPNYVEGKFMIAFNQDWNRSIDYHGARNFCDWIESSYDEIYKNLPIKVKEYVDRKNEENAFWWGNIYVPSEAYWLFNDHHRIARQYVTASLAESMNGMDSTLKLKEGMKMSRAINKICCYLGIDKLPDYNKEFAKFADSVNPLKITRHTIISIHPVDYLTMSFGNSWASCHTIDKVNARNMPHGYEGQYSSGTISYMLDKVSMVFYTVDASYNGDLYYYQSKINRCMFHYGEDRLIQGRVYPQSNDSNEDGIYKDIREIVQRVMAHCLEMPNYWETKKGIYEIEKYVHSKGTHYPDYKNFNNCCISFPKGYEWDGTVITIGHNPICIECGETHTESDNINHCASGIKECAECGRHEHEDDMYYIDDDWYCNECAGRCDRCDCACTNENLTWINCDNRYVCDDCCSEYYTYCEVCEEYVRDYDTTWIEYEDREICDSCRDAFYRDCDECGETFRTRDMEYDANTDHHYCSACWEDMQSEENENEEVC